MPSMETSSTSNSASASSVSVSSLWAGPGSGAGTSMTSAIATRSLMALSLAAQTWTMNAAAPFPSRGDEYNSHVNVTLCHKQGLSGGDGVDHQDGGGSGRAAWPAARHQPARAGADRAAPVHRAGLRQHHHRADRGRGRSQQADVLPLLRLEDQRAVERVRPRGGRDPGGTGRGAGRGAD